MSVALVIAPDRANWKALYAAAAEATPVPDKNTVDEATFVAATKRRNAARYVCQLVWERDLDPAAILADHDFTNHDDNRGALDDLLAVPASTSIPDSTINRWERLNDRTSTFKSNERGKDRATISKQCREMQKKLRDLPSANKGVFAAKFLSAPQSLSLAENTEEVEIDF
jgi:hypothetical protein